MKCIKNYVIFLTIFVMNSANAYYSVMDNGNIIENGKYRIIAGPQILLSGSDGVNFSTRLDAGISHSSNMRALIGGGSTDFYAGLALKNVPFPDYGNQPAIGFIFAATFARIDVASETINSVTAHFMPIVSKEFELEFGKITPYASIPIGTKFFDGETEFLTALAIGSELRLAEIPHFSLMTEVGLNLNKSFNYINLGIVFYFDEEEGLKINN